MDANSIIRAAPLTLAGVTAGITFVLRVIDARVRFRRGVIDSFDAVMRVVKAFYLSLLVFVSAYLFFLFVAFLSFGVAP